MPTTVKVTPLIDGANYCISRREKRGQHPSDDRFSVIYYGTFGGGDFMFGDLMFEIETIECWIGILLWIHMTGPGRKYLIGYMDVWVYECIRGPGIPTHILPAP